jgi:hypothetical protein
MPKTLDVSMYDVVYIDAQGEETPVAQQLNDRKHAAEVACKAAAERGAGRMMLPGSSRLPNCVCVIPVPPAKAA